MGRLRFYPNLFHDADMPPSCEANLNLISFKNGSLCIVSDCVKILRQLLACLDVEGQPLVIFGVCDALAHCLFLTWISKRCGQERCRFWRQQYCFALCREMTRFFFTQKQVNIGTPPVEWG